jgi:hypothetical protein
MRVDLQLSPSFFVVVSSYASDAEHAVRVFRAIRVSLDASETSDFVCFDNNDEKKIASEEKEAKDHHRHEKRGASDALQQKR